MPFVHRLRDLSDPNSPHEYAPEGIISLSWAFLIVPCIFLLGAFVWIGISFSQPSEFPQENGYHQPMATLDETEEDEHEHDESAQLLEAFQERPSHNTSSSHTAAASGRSEMSEKPITSGWKINGKFSSTSRGGSIYTSYPDPNGVHHSPTGSISSPKSKRASLNLDGRPKSVGSKAARAQALDRERMAHDLERLDPIDREELQRSPSQTSSSRKHD
ncbi:hypothetical protein BCV70DRAFT_68810 [Testicularia cyperi]|uniref:Uncharacterized protein n=1 Tax=Testicularia cyperi TaxID=1882483 RepID=A0A317XHE0_9BASI|nr:hypothetical protein BCV70DRAFT_68810 [Testicularia cyperi]